MFAVDVQHIYDLVKVFRENGIDARGVDGRTRAFDRQQLLADFRARKFPVLINCGAFLPSSFEIDFLAIITEGVDIPPIDCIILARPTRSSVLLQQMIGRGLRLSPGKEYCLVLDFEDILHKKVTRASVPTLFGLSPSFDLQGMAKASSK